MFDSSFRKVTVGGLLTALGILIPLTVSHTLQLLPGNVFLLMHIPVLLCGFSCGSLYGGICGAVLPFLNSALTGMPVMFPNAVIMSFELFTYGLVSGYLYRRTGYSNKLRHIYPVLVISMLAGRVVYGLTASLLVLFNPALSRLSAIGATVTGIPGIIIQLIVIPKIVATVRKNTMLR